MRRHLFVLALCLAVPGLASAMTVDDLSPGKTVHGTKLTVPEMHGKVVYVEYWGTR